MLCEAQVLEIYKLKISIMHDLYMCCESGNPNQWLRGKNIPVALRYGVTPRAIRDIWNRKTWAYATQQLWPLESSYDNFMKPRGLAPVKLQSVFSRFYANWFYMQVRMSHRQPGRPKGSQESRQEIHSHSMLKKTEAGEEILFLVSGDLGLDPQWRGNSPCEDRDDFIDPFHADWAHW